MNGATAANGGGGGGDNAGWDPFASPQAAPAQQPTSQQPVPTSNNQGQSMGWDNSLWDDQTSGAPQTNAQPQPAANGGFGNFQQPGQQQPASQPQPTSNNADDLWGDFNGGVTQPVQPQQPVTQPTPQ